jgi:3-oxoadipate enol-lactonase
MDFIELQDTAIRYELVPGGAAPTVVLIHEMGGTLESWDEVVPLLREECCTLRYDVRGAGQSEKIAGGVTMDDLVGDLDGLLTALGLRTPVVISGNAVGAAIALAFAARRPERTAGVVAFSPALGIPPQDREARLAMLEPLGRDGMRHLVNGALDAGYPQQLRDASPERFRAFRARWLGNDPESFVATYRMLAFLDMQEALAAIRCPVLGVCGTLDGFRPPAHVREALRPIADVEFTEIEACHHQPAATPVPVAAEIRRFLKRLNAAG